VTQRQTHSESTDGARMPGSAIFSHAGHVTAAKRTPANAATVSAASRFLTKPLLAAT